MKSIHRRPQEKGFAIVAYAAMLIGVIGFTGLAVDVGYLQYQKRRIQSAADAAAMGALREMERGNTDLAAAGQNDSSLNGFTNGQSNTTVTISNPPASGSYSGQTTAVQATVQSTIPTFFMQIFGQKGVPIAATAVAQTSNASGSIGGCIFVLNSSASPAFNFHGTMNLETACSVVVNSSAAGAITGVGNATILLDNNAKVGVVGSYSMSGGANITNNKTHAAETPVTIQSFSDPLANVAPPAASSGYTLRVASGGMTVDKNSMPAGGLLPGIYCGGLDLKSTNGTLTLNSGTYILAGGGLTVDAQANVQSASGGVMFYNTSSSSDSWGCTGNSSASSITINGGGTLNLTALTSSDVTLPGSSGPVGILFFDDRSLVTSHKINGNSGNTFNGALYFKKSALNFIGTSSTGGYLVIVCDTLDIGGTSALGNDYTTLTTVNTIAPGATGGGLVQ